MKTNFPLFPFFLLGALILFTIIQFPFVSKVHENYWSIYSEKLLLVTINSPCSSFRRRITVTYPALVACASQKQKVDIQGAIKILNMGLEKYPNRAPLILAAKAKMIALQDVKQACSILTGIRSAPIMLDLAKAAYLREDYASSEGFLSCLDGMDDRNRYVSLFEIGDLYYKLALQADAAGQTASAERNYQNAIDAYPILRADIIIRLSEVIYAENPIDSIRLLLRYFVDANDPKAIFDLSRHLGLIWEDLHDLDKAYCAYSKAFQQASSLDENLAPAEWRRDLVDRIALISNSIMTETLDCQAFWARLKASP